MNKKHVGLVLGLSAMMCAAALWFSGITADAKVIYISGDMQEAPKVYSEGDAHPGLFAVGDVFTYEQITYRVLSVENGKESRGTVEAIGYEEGITDINIPEYLSSYNEDFKYRITNIQDGAFKNCKTATNFWISPDSPIRKIPAYMCDGCSKLTIVQLRGKKLRQIGKRAFYNCKKLRITQIYTSKMKKFGKQSFKHTHKGMHLQVNGVECIQKYTKKIQKAGAKKVNCYEYDDF